jgi:hypothetical protein
MRPGVAGVAGVQEYRSSGVQEFRSSGVTGVRSGRVVLALNRLLVKPNDASRINRRLLLQLLQLLNSFLHN